ncbi:MAG: hypothetical protein R2865_08780 [Deinococcales bacterium]
MAALYEKIKGMEIGLFGGGGGITFPDELKAGASGVIPGVGFNEVFIDSWRGLSGWGSPKVVEVLSEHQPLSMQFQVRVMNIHFTLVRS